MLPLIMRHQSIQGSIALTLANPTHGNEKKLRAIVSSSNEADGAIKLHGGIENGEMVQVCLASPAQLQQEVQRITQAARLGGFQPSAALIVSCAGRKWMLGGKVEFEVQAIHDAFPMPAGEALPIVGFPSFGEFGPLRSDTGYAGYTRNLFHNMTYVLLLLGTCHE